MLPFLNQYLKDGAAVGHRAGHRVRDRPQPLAAPRRLAARLRPRLPGEPHRRSTWRPAASSASTSPPAAPSTATSPIPPNPVTYRAAPNLSPWAAGSTWRTWLVDDQRFAAAPPRRPRLHRRRSPSRSRLAGTPLVHLVASTSGSDSDWVVKLIDVYPDPYPHKPDLAAISLPIAMDVIRGRYRTDPARPAPAPRQPAAHL